ncbi:hypothetical protein [Nonomuraea sp. NPDC002799]
MADCERGLGRPERAIDLVRTPEAERLDRAGRIELAIVESGARRDLGQHDAAVITLQRLPELRDPQPKPWSARLAFAYADALAEAGHQDAATDWFGRAMAFDEEGETEAAERYAELTGAVIEDLEEDFDDASDEDSENSEDDLEVSERDLEATEGEREDLDGDLQEDSEDSEEDLGDNLADYDEDEEEDDELEDDESEDDEEADDAAALAEAGDLLSGEPARADASDEDTRPVAESDSSAAQNGTADDSEVPAAPAQPEIRGITPAFIEPDFGDKLDESDAAPEDKRKTDN